MKEKSNQYWADLSINKFKLNDELLHQPQLYYEYAYKTAQAKNDMDDAKDELDIKKSEIEATIRKEGKFTKEGEIKNAVEINRSLRSTREKYTEARRKYNLLGKAEKAFEQRKSMLQTYVYLQVHNISSDVKVPQSHQREMSNEFSNEIKNQLSSSLKRRKKDD